MEQERVNKKGRFKVNLPLVSKKTYLILILVFISLGIGGGYLYYTQVACSSGACAINSNPYFSMLWGGLVGYLIPDLVVKKKSD